MEYQALYRQFRPSNFDEIVEQKAAVATLRKTVQIGKIGHAYLFCGQRGTGKTSIARVFARAINCENPVNGNPCNQCALCKGILDGSLMDVIEIDAASNRSIDNIRNICEEVNYAPSRAKYKVYIIDEVHMITTEAFNALLKTLEEPPAHAVFLFATTEPHQIPPTILSRCQRFDFRRISTEAIKKRLRFICDHEKINANDEALEYIASLSDGAMRDAISYLDQASAMASSQVITPESIEEMTGTVNIDFIADFATILIEGSFDKLPEKCKELADSGRDYIQFTLDLAEYFRNLLVIRVVPDPVRLVTSSARSLERMYKIVNLTNSQTLVGFVGSFSKIVSDLKWSPSIRTSFEISMLRLCGRKVRMEEPQLVIPDFAKLQEQAARKISEGEADLKHPSPFKAAKEESVDEIKPELTVKEPAQSAKEPEKEAEAKSAETELKEDKPAPETANPSPAISDAKEKIEALKAKTAGILGTGTAKAPDSGNNTAGIAAVKDKSEVSDSGEDLPLPWDEPESKEQEDKKQTAASIPATAPVPNSVPAPVEEEIPEEDRPLENQIGLLFDTEDAGKSPKVGIFADLSDSVLDDIGREDESEEEEDADEDINGNGSDLTFGDEDDDLQAPTGRIGETRRTALSTAVEKSPIVRPKNVQTVTDPMDIWREIRSLVYEKDREVGIILDDCRMEILGEGAYIIIGSGTANDARQLGTLPGFKYVSSLVKHKVNGIRQVFSCTQRQFVNVQNKYYSEHPQFPEPQPAPQKPSDGGAPFDKDPAADFIRGLAQAGYNTEIHDTEIHFGDE